MQHLFFSVLQLRVAGPSVDRHSVISQTCRASRKADRHLSFEGLQFLVSSDRGFEHRFRVRGVEQIMLSDVGILTILGFVFEAILVPGGLKFEPQGAQNASKRLPKVTPQTPWGPSWCPDGAEVDF